MSLNKPAVIYMLIVAIAVIVNKSFNLKADLYVGVFNILFLAYMLKKYVWS